MTFTTAAAMYIAIMSIIAWRCDPLALYVVNFVILIGAVLITPFFV